MSTCQTASQTSSFHKLQQFNASHHASLLSCAEETALRHELSEAEKELNEYEKDISKLISLKVGKENDRARLQRQVDKGRAFFAPIRRLPTELLAQVFLQCEFRQDKMPVQLDAVRLGWVCSTWRRTALSTPRLWTNIQIWRGVEEDLTNVGEEKLVRRQKSLLTHLLKLSAGLPLSITIVTAVTRPDFVHKMAMYSALWRLLAVAAPRWRCLKISAGLQDFALLDRMITNGLPELQYLDIMVITSEDEDEPEDDPPALNLFSVLPKLELLQLADEYLETFTLPRQTIRKLRIVDTRPGSILPGFTELTHLHLKIFAPLPLPTHPGQKPYVARHLTDLTLEERPDASEALSFHAGSWTAKSFYLLRAPSLTSLKMLPPKVYDQRAVPVLEFDSVRSFISRSQCSLRELVISIPLQSCQDLVALLLTTPALESFTLEEPFHLKYGVYELGKMRLPCIADDLVQELDLAKSDRDPPLLPRLSELTIHVDRGRETFLQPEALERMILSRWRPDRKSEDEEQCLMMVSIWMPDDYLVDGAQHVLRHLKMAGLRLDLQFPPIPEDAL